MWLCPKEGSYGRHFVYQLGGYACLVLAPTIQLDEEGISKNESPLLLAGLTNLTLSCLEVFLTNTDHYQFPDTDITRSGEAHTNTHLHSSEPSTGFLMAF